MRRFLLWWGGPLCALATASCSSPAPSGPAFGELPYPLPTAGSGTQSIAMTKLNASLGDSFLEPGCVTFAEVHCEGARPSSIAFWRFCQAEGEWKQLADDAYTFTGAGLCAEYDPRDMSKQNKRCVDGRCEGTSCTIYADASRHFSEENHCESHASGTAAGTTSDCSWDESIASGLCKSP
jgi:hypothetical protein